MNNLISQIDFQKNKGLVPAIAQDCQSGEVLMLAFQNEEALEKTLQTGLAHYFSRSRQKLWQKGEESGHIQKVVEVFYDCDADTILMKVEQKGPACHTGTTTCFTDRFLPVVSERVRTAARLLFKYFKSLENEKFRSLSGTAKILLDRDLDLVSRKIEEEREEVLGVLDGSHQHKSLPEDTILESAQFFYWSCLQAILEEKDFLDFFENFFVIKNPIFALHHKAGLPLYQFLERDIIEIEKKPYFSELKSLAEELS